MLEDVGVHIPYAKKDLHTQSSNTDQDKKTHITKRTTLKSLWPEPDWKELYLDGYSKDTLAAIYSIYHSLRKQPHDKTAHIGDGKVHYDMWESAYVEVIEFIRQGCESATSIDTIESLKSTFRLKFPNKGPELHKAYAAGHRTAKTYLHTLKQTTTTREYTNLLPHLDWPMNVKAKSIALFPILLVHTQTKKETYSLCEINKTRYYLPADDKYKNQFVTYEEAVKALITFHGDSFHIKHSDESSPPLYTPIKDVTQLPGVESSYPNRTPEELMQKYGFRGIQFGNYLPNHERQSYVNNTYHSLGLLSTILGIPKHWIGAGKLGLAFGARGAGNSAAHFEIELNVINCTRRNGQGSIAHETFHSFDSRVNEKWFGNTGLLSQELTKIGSHRLEPPAKNAVRFTAFRTIVNTCTKGNSLFVLNALRIESQKGSKKYWSLPHELCARAFEAYIEDTLLDNGITKQWLACKTQPKDYPINGMHPYPTG